jgi:hypothetical protein
MRFGKKLALLLFTVICVVFGLNTFSFGATHLVGPEDNSVYIDQREPDTTKSDKGGILTASELSENARIVIHFDLTGWAPDSIFQAKLHLYHYRGGNYSGTRTLNVCPLTSGFDETVATWNTPWSTPGGDYDNSISASADVPEAWGNWVVWDVTGLVKDRWSYVSTCGFLIKDPVEDTPVDGPYVRFRSHRYILEFPEELPYLEIVTDGTGVEEVQDESSVGGFSLGQNYPNPFNRSTIFEYRLAEAGRVSLLIYNVRGEKVCTLVEAEKKAGKHTVEWDGTNSSGQCISSGIYLYRLEAAESSETRRLLYLK